MFWEYFPGAAASNTVLSKDRRLPFRLSRFFIGTTLVLTMAVTVGLGLALWLTYDSQRRITINSLESTTAIFAATVERTLGGLESVLQVLRLEILNNGFQPPRLQSLLSQLRQDNPHLRTVLVLDQDATVVADSRVGSPTVGMNVVDRQYFSVHNRTHRQSLFLDDPVQNRLDGAWSIPMSLGLWRDNDFLGVVVASLEPRYFSELMATVAQGSTLGGALINERGKVMAAFPYQSDHIGQVINTSALYQATVKEQGLWQGWSAFSGDTELMAYRQLPDRGITVELGVDTAALHLSIRSVNLAWVVVFAIVLLTAWGALLYQWRFSRLLMDGTQRLQQSGQQLAEEVERRVQVEDHLRSERDQLQRYLDLAPMMVLVIDPSSQVLQVNRRTCEVLGFAESALLGQRWLQDFVPPIFHAEIRHRVFAPLLQRSQQSVYHESPVVTQQGQRLIAWWNTLIPRQGEQQTHGMLCIGDDITEQRHNEERLAYLAHHDPLTGLANRTLFEELVQEAVQNADRRYQTLAVLCIDLDLFKHVNDSLGYGVGDTLIEQVAKRLEGGLRRNDLLARFGGDEFTLLVVDSDDYSGVGQLAEKILSLLNEGFCVDDHRLYVGASIGISCYPQDGKDFQTLLRCAELAMYQAKEAGRNTHRFFSRELNAKVQELLVMHTQLRQGLARGEFRLLYQPKVDLLSGQLGGLEALLRWDNSVLGSVSPARFIPVAEQSGLIQQLGDWVLTTACQQICAWHQQGLVAPRVAVNLSVRQFHQADLVRRIGEILTETGVDARHLELEVTEGVLIQDPTQAVAVLAELRAMGISLAVDDFGTGFSSLAYLKRLPVDILKIDKSFVDGLPDAADDQVIVETILVAARNFGLQVVAEGVETEAQYHWLRQAGCDQSQGYYFAKPLTAVELIPWLASPTLPLLEQ